MSGAGVSHTLTKSSSAVLPLVGVGVGGIQTSALLDSGSNVSFVARSLVCRLGLSESPAYMEVGTIAGIEKKRTSTVSLTLGGEVTMSMRGVFVTYNYDPRTSCTRSKRVSTLAWGAIPPVITCRHPDWTGLWFSIA